MANNTTGQEYDVEIEYIGLGPVSATASADGQFIVMDFLNGNDVSKAMRLAIPAEHLENMQAALAHLQKALANPLSGIHYKDPH